VSGATALLGALGPVLRPHGKEAFLRGLPDRARLLDVGCGNDSPARAKACAPTLHYTGLDVGDYNQHAGSIAAADEYLITTPEQFAATLEGFAGRFDAVVSSHNLEHCNEPARVLAALCGALAPRGRLYLSFPSEASAHLPRRPRNTLNFFDDPTHAQIPRLAEVLPALGSGGLSITFLARRYRPPIPWLAGLLLEPVSFLSRRSMPLGSTWALYGFETVIWAERR
jgi:SAM-dependent methyltransferase